jgi:hypothetical protein
MYREMIGTEIFVQYLDEFHASESSEETSSDQLTKQ